MTTHRRGVCQRCGQQQWLELVHLAWVCAACRAAPAEHVAASAPAARLGDGAAT